MPTKCELGQLPKDELQIEAIKIWLIQHFEADFLWKVSLKILNSGIILKMFTHGIQKLGFPMACHISLLHMLQYRWFRDDPASLT